MFEILIIVLATFAGVVGQTVVGFGFGSFLLVTLLLYFSAPIAIITTLLTANVLSGLTLSGEKRKSSIHWPIVWHLLLASIPGIGLGAFLGTHTDKAVTQIIVGLLIILSVAVQEYVFPKPTRRLGITKGIHLSGFASGVLQASAGLSIPPLIIWLRSHIVSANQIRDNLAVIFLIMNTCSILAIWFISRPHFEAKSAWLGLLLPIILMGYGLGRLLLKQINPKQYQKLIFYVVIVVGLASIIAGFENL